MLKAENAAGSIEQIFSAGDISRTKHKAWYGKKKQASGLFIQDEGPQGT
jgi:hypothetical protein